MGILVKKKAAREMGRVGKVMEEEFICISRSL